MRKLLLATAAVALLVVAEPQATLAGPVPEAADLAFAPLSVPAPKAGRARPLVAVVAARTGAETTDFTIPYAVLKESGVANVVSLSTVEGPVPLIRAIRIVADATTAQFDAEQPLGADIVIVPAQMSPKDDALRAWIRGQADRGAVIVSICEGARVLANAGLLEGRRAATHWSAFKGLEKAYPKVAWVRDRRYVQDGPIISTTGVSASIPASLALVEAIGGRAVALATANRIGVSEWGAAHRTNDFWLTTGDISRAVASLGAVWTHERVEFPIAPGVDELALALKTDVWTRTVRSRVVTTSADPEVRSKHGLRIVADARPVRRAHVVQTTTEPGQTQLETAFAEISERYGRRVERLAKMGMEYDEPLPAAPSQLARSQ